MYAELISLQLILFFNSRNKQLYDGLVKRRFDPGESDIDFVLCELDSFNIYDNEDQVMVETQYITAEKAAEGIELQ